MGTRREAIGRAIERTTCRLRLIAASASVAMLCTTQLVLAQTPGSYHIVSKNSGRCLDVMGWSRESGAAIQQYACHGGENQLFRLDPAGPGYFRLVAWHSGKCLDIAGGSIANGAGVQQYDCHGGPNQLFRLERTNDGSFLLRAGHSGKCIDVRGWRREDGVPIQQYDCHGGDNQGWWLQYGRPRR